MTAARQFAKLKLLSDLPQTEEVSWLSSAAAAPGFLPENAGASDVLIYASMPNVLVHGVLAPISQVTPPDVSDLLRAYYGPEDSWVIQKAIGGGEGARVYLEPPMESPGCKSLVGSEKLIFRRSFHGMNGYEPPIELSQKLVHALGLHFMEARSAYCRLDDNGDVEDVISILPNRPKDASQSCTAIFIKSRDLAEFMALSDTVLFRKFDFTRFLPESFNGWSNQASAMHGGGDFAFNSGLGASASYANGYHIARTSLTRDALSEEWEASFNGLNKQYETFKILDWKNGVQVECSADPGSISNYFTESTNPFEISPAFFRPEILHKYKADPEKYTIDHRSISCRNSWELKTFDINEEGQVHTYIGYLAKLPYSEQQYWKLYNEWPKGPISARAFETDFEGNFPTQSDPLVELQQAISKIEKSNPGWWSIRPGEALPKVLYPVSASSKEWADELLALDQLVIEGFYQKGLKELAAKLGVSLDSGWASLKIVEALLVGIGATKDRAETTLAPLRELHHLRSMVKGHATAERKILEDKALREHGSFRLHFSDLAKRCANSFSEIVRVLRSDKQTD